MIFHFEKILFLLVELIYLVNHWQKFFMLPFRNFSEISIVFSVEISFNTILEWAEFFIRFIIPFSVQILLKLFFELIQLKYIFICNYVVLLTLLLESFLDIAGFFRYSLSLVANMRFCETIIACCDFACHTKDVSLQRWVEKTEASFEGLNLFL